MRVNEDEVDCLFVKYFTAEIRVVFTHSEHVKSDDSIVFWSVWRVIFDVLFQVIDYLILHLKSFIQSGNYTFLTDRVVRVWLQGKTELVEFVDVDRK